MSDYLLDTNVISAFAKPEANKPVINWLQTAAPETFFISVITIGELRLGIEDLPSGKRRSELELWLAAGLPQWFDMNDPPITKRIGERWGRLTIEAKRKGITPGTPDGLIAATALEHDLTVLTRNAKDFVGLGVSFFNPSSIRGTKRMFSGNCSGPYEGANKRRFAISSRPANRHCRIS